MQKEYVETLRKKLHVRWYHMITRCYNPNSITYKWYGAKGIVVCDEWKEFDNFFNDAQKIDGWDEKLFMLGFLSIDKDYKQVGIDNKVYSLNTCAWVPYYENHRYVKREELEEILKIKDTINMDAPIRETIKKSTADYNNGGKFRKNIDIDKIISLYANGMTIDNISKELGISYGTVRNALIRCEIEIRPCGESAGSNAREYRKGDKILSEEEIELLPKMYLGGMTARQIAEKFGIRLKRVEKYLAKLGVRKR